MRIKIVEYGMAGPSAKAPELVERVNAMIKDGWEPFGNLTIDVYQHNGSTWFYQPMVKVESVYG